MYFFLVKMKDFIDVFIEEMKSVDFIVFFLVDIFVIFDFIIIINMGEQFNFVLVLVWFGVQDMYWEDLGVFIGEVSFVVFKEVGVKIVEVGYVERWRIFGEDDVIMVKKMVVVV